MLKTESTPFANVLVSGHIIHPSPPSMAHDEFADEDELCGDTEISEGLPIML
jgi:hypothetical protein